jgi:hypothetical protein
LVEFPVKHTVAFARSRRPAFIFKTAMIVMMVMTTISVSTEVRDELLKYAAELQAKLGRRVDLEEAVRHLLSRRSAKDPHLLKEACKPIPGAKKAIKELLQERKRDEERLKRKVSPRR